MHTVELMDEALRAAAKLGYKVRHEWLDGGGGGACEFGGRKWLFIDLALNTMEQFDQVIDALREDPRFADLDLSPRLRRMAAPRKAA